jgi:K+ transporter
MVSVLTLVFAFRTSAALAYAFGMAVTGTITITTLLFFYVVRHQWRTPLWLVLAGCGSLLVVDLLFFAANLTKITHGAWLPLLTGVSVFTVLITWQRGRALVTARRERDEGSLRRSSTSSMTAARRCSASPVPHFFSKIELHTGEEPGLRRWRKHLFVATSRITADAAEYLGLPRERTVIMRSRIEV